MRKKRKFNIKGFAFFQIYIIVLFVFSFSFIIGDVSAQGPSHSPPVALIVPSEIDSLHEPVPAFEFTPESPYPPYGIKGVFPKFLTTGPVAHLFRGAVQSITAFLAVEFVADLIGLDEPEKRALQFGAIAGIMSGKFVVFAQEASIFPELFGKEAILGNAAFVGIGVGITVFLLTYKKEEKKLVQFQCLPWEPPIGGASCEECNKDQFRPCSEYRCRSLGQACELINKGSEEEACVWVSRGDVTSPIITPWQKVLSEGHSYTSHEERPPSRGTRIVRDNAKDGCLQAFTPLKFGILTNEPAQCKIDYSHTENFEEMTFYFGASNYHLYNHTQEMSLPSPDSINAEFPELQNDGIYDLFVRCKDANGNVNEDEFVFSFCVDPSPDTTPPVIEETSIENGAPVQFGVGEINVDFYINEPSECKWSIGDKNYDEMENAMSCSKKIIEINAQNLYTCSSTLKGIKDREENNYYVRCKDQPSKPDNERNVNVQSYNFVLKGTESLNIINVGPNGTISDSTDVVSFDLTVETSNGANEGKAICYFSSSEEGDYITMFETNNFEHRQTLTLPEGDYTYYFRCVDAGGNSDEAKTSFKVLVDTIPPMVTRAYRELDALKIVTSEKAECVYSLNNCNYNLEEGIAMIHVNPSERTRHFTPWEPNLVYYIKCQDDFGNEPPPNTCSIIVSATNIV